MRSLVLINQIPLLLAAINELEGWHAKIENLEIEIQRFRDHDLKLYGNWEQLTIQKHQDEIDRLIASYKDLTDFHNWVVFTAGDLDISLPHAYHLMKQEEELFQKGSLEEKEKIAELRENRKKEIRNQIDEEFGYSSDSEDDGDDDDGEDPTENISQKSREELINEARARYQREIHYYEKLNDKKIKKIMQNFDEGLFLLFESAGVCLEAFRLDLILKFWTHAPAKMKKAFNEIFKDHHGITLDDLLKQVEHRARTEAGVEPDEEFDFSAHFENPFAKSPKEKSVAPENLESAKIFYRRLMLNVHPDKLPADFVVNKKSWLDRLWKKIQTAYGESNVAALKNLHLQVLITLKKYDQMSYSELKEGTGLLEKEFKRTYESQRQTYAHPAWGFSELKSYKKLEKEVVAPYASQKKEIRKEIGRIEKTHAALNEYAQQILQSGGFRHPRKTTKKKTKKKKTRRIF